MGDMEAEQDSISLLRMIKGLCCKFDPTKQEARAIVPVDKAIMCYMQESHTTNLQYFKKFNALVDTTLRYKSSSWPSKSLVLAKMGTDHKNATMAQKIKALEMAQ